MSTTNQITGGGFTDFENNPLAGGYIVLDLSHDEQANSLTQIVAGLRIKIQLDTNGNIPTTPALNVWPNDVLLPAGSFYIVEAFRSDGTRAWRAPQYWTILSSPSPFNVGTIIPTNPPVAGAVLGSLTLQTNEVNNGSQSLLDLHAGPGVTITDNGSGRVTFTAGGGVITSGGNLLGGSVPPLNTVGSINSSFTGGMYISASGVATQFSGNIKIGFQAGPNNVNGNGLDIVKAVILTTAPNGTTVTTNTALLFSGSASVTVPANALLYCDAFNYTIDTTKDYYILFLSGTVNKSLLYGQTLANSALGAAIQPGIPVTGDQTGATTISSSVFTLDTSTFWRAISGIKIA